MKLTKPGQDGASQLISSVRQTSPRVSTSMKREIPILRPATDGPADLEANHAPLGPQSAVRAALESVVGDGTWQGLGQGIFDGMGFSLLATLGISPTVDTLTIELWGEGDATSSIRQLCSASGWQAVDLETWTPVFLANEP